MTLRNTENTKDEEKQVNITNDNITSGFDSNTYADLFRQEMHYKIIEDRHSRTGQICFYNKKLGKYEFISADSFKGIIKNGIPRELYSPKIVDNIFRDLTTDPPGSPHLADISELNSNAKCINFQNGILDWRTGKLYNHSPKLLSTIQIPCDYPVDGINYDCPKVLNDFLMHCFGGDKEQIHLFYQFIGVAISNIDASKAKKALFIIGENDTGKSILRNLIISLVGKENSDSTDLDTLNKRFGASSLYHKRIGGCSDMKYKKIHELDIFKQLTGGDMIQTEFKNQNSFNMKFMGLLIFCANRFPIFGGDTQEPVFERMCIMKAVGKAYHHSTKPFPGIVYKDSDLLEKLLADDVRQYIVYNAIQALKEFVDNKYEYSMTSKNEQYLEEYKDVINSVPAFIRDCCILKSESAIPIDHFSVKTIYDVYQNWCGQGSITKNIYDKKEFKELLCQLGCGSTAINNGYECFSAFTLNQQTRTDFNAEPVTKPMNFD